MNLDEVVDWEQVKQGMQTRVLDDGPNSADATVVSRYFSAFCKHWESDPLFRAFVQQSYGNNSVANECLQEVDAESSAMEEAFHQFVTYDDLARIAEEDNKAHKLQSLKRSMEETAMDE